MSAKDDTKKLGLDLAADVRDLLLEWFPSALRFVLFLLIFHLLVGLERPNATEVAALLAFADVATHRTTQRARVREDLKLVVHKGKTSITKSRHED